MSQVFLVRTNHHFGAGVRALCRFVATEEAFLSPASAPRLIGDVLSFGESWIVSLSFTQSTLTAASQPSNMSLCVSVRVVPPVFTSRVEQVDVRTTSLAASASTRRNPPRAPTTSRQCLCSHRFLDERRPLLVSTFRRYPSSRSTGAPSLISRPAPTYRLFASDGPI